MVAHRAHNPKVGGSNPPSATINLCRRIAMDETIKLWLDMLDDKTLNGLMREVSDVEGSIKNAETMGTRDYIPALETYLEVLKDMIKEQKSVEA